MNNKQHYRHMIVKDIHKMINCTLAMNYSEIKLTGIVSLRISQISSIGSATNKDNKRNKNVKWNNNVGQFLKSILTMIPNLREIDFSNINENGLLHALYNFGFNPKNKIETIRWNNANFESSLLLDGSNLNQCENLKQLFLDDSIFHCNDRGRNYGWFGRFEEEVEVEGPVNNNDNTNNNNINNTINNIFIFHICCEKIERVSIRNAKYNEENHNSINNTITTLITQKALIKFVRNAPPTLQWFRSNLSKANIDMLHKERPTIELLN